MKASTGQTGSIAHGGGFWTKAGRRRRGLMRLGIGLALALPLLGGCGAVAPQVAGTPTAATGTAETSAALPADWKLSVVKIIVAGSPVEPNLGAEIQMGTGSGFIIHPSGLVLTNNHVASGVGLVRVLLPGETEPRSARVLRVSECSDLALLQIEGEGPFPALDWYQGPIDTELGVRKGGYPGGAATIVVGDGIISQTGVDAFTEWAAVRKALLHSAKILRGDSGGVLVAEEDGHWRVVGVNFASNNADDRNYAIGRDEVQRFVEAARADTGVAYMSSVGINGVAVTGKLGEETVSGVWVRAVVSGSPADQARVEAGDLITVMEGLPLAEDGTMQIYCEFVRERYTEPLSIEVLRSHSGERLRGQINGRPLEADPRHTPGPGASTTPAAPSPQAGDGLVDFGSFSEADITAARELYASVRGEADELLFETFQDGDRTRGRWLDGDEAESEAGSALLRNYVYEIVLKQPNNVVTQLWQEGGAARRLAGDYILELDVALASGPTAAAGIAFGRAERGGAAFLVHGDGSWQLVSFLDGSSDNGYTTGKVPSQAILGGGNVNQLGVMRQGGGLRLYVNNTLVAEVQDFPLGDGGLGVSGVATGDPLPIRAVADNLRVLQP